MEEAGMDTEHCTITELLALKDAPDDALLDQVDAIGERAARLQHVDQQTARACGRPGRLHRRADPAGVIGNSSWTDAE
jgi:hypothetical protein